VVRVERSVVPGAFFASASSSHRARLERVEARLECDRLRVREGAIDFRRELARGRATTDGRNPANRPSRPAVHEREEHVLRRASAGDRVGRTAAMGSAKDKTPKRGAAEARAANRRSVFIVTHETIRRLALSRKPVD